MDKEKIDSIVDTIMGSAGPAKEITHYTTADGTVYSEENCADFHNDVMTLFEQYNLLNDAQRCIRAAAFRELMLRYCIITE